MKTVILSSPKKHHRVISNKRFQTLVCALNDGGINGSHHILYSWTHLLQILQTQKPDIVFSAAYYTYNDANELVNIHRILDELKIPYVGSAPETLDFVLSKSELKDRWKKQSIPTPNYFLVKSGEHSLASLAEFIKLNQFPYILKPDKEGNSRGLSEASIVFDQKTLLKQLSHLFDQYNEILVEQYLGQDPNMREFTVAMIGNGEQKILMPAEIFLLRKHKVRIITTEDKDRHFTRALPVKNEELKERLIALATRAFKAAGVCDYSRCDIIYSQGQLYATEINGKPMMPDKWFEACSRGAGLDPSQYVNAIFLAAIARNMERSGSHLAIPLEMKALFPTSIYNRLLSA
jgi:D-alanine-D-alanine ligase